MKTIATHIISFIKKLLYLASPEGELVSYGAVQHSAEKKNALIQKQKQEPGGQDDAEKAK